MREAISAREPGEDRVMAKHSPGHWRWTPDGHDNKSARVSGGNADNSFDTVEDEGYLSQPNARLIAAAPELLQSLKGFLSAMNRFGNWDDGCFYYGSRSSTELQILLEPAKAAIAKAEGRTP